MMGTIKAPAVAGLFYPKEADVLQRDVENYLNQGILVDLLPKCIVAPHAGYEYSGAVAGSAYAVLRQYGQSIKRVILLGPAHRVPVTGCVLPSFDYFATPLGKVPLDKALINELLKSQPLRVYDEAFENEHSLEVQLPFLQRALSDFTLVPILVGQANFVAVANLLAQVWRGPETLIVVSTDLSHYLPYADALVTDIATLSSVSHLRIDQLKMEHACGFFPLMGLMHFARAIGLTARAIEYKNSGDTAGDKARVVGYGAYHFYNADESAGLYTFDQKQMLMYLAKQAIINELTTHEPLAVDLTKMPFHPETCRDSFVTLEKKGQLRGCIGSIEAKQPVTLDVSTNAFKAAFKDPRFSPVEASELNEISLSISLLSKFMPLEVSSEEDLFCKIRPGIDGVVFQDQGRSALFLPHVWTLIPDRKKFLVELKKKAGFSEDYWSDTVRILTFTADMVF